MTADRVPVEDWTTDFDYFDPAFTADPYPVWDRLREQCPVAHSERWGGAWMPTRYEDIAAVAHDTTAFSSRDVGVTRAENLEGPLLVAPPITSDPPEHTSARRLLLPAFSPKAVDRLEQLTRDIARVLLDELAGRDRADAAADYAQHIPVRVISLLIGIPPEEEARFTDWVVRVLQVGPTNPEVGREATREVLAYFREQVEQRREEPRDDLITYLLDARLDGAPLSEKHVLGTCFLLLVAGIDTTWSAIGSSLWYLGSHPEERDRLVADPSLVPTAIEELLRAYAPVTMARVVRNETEVGGRKLCPGEKVLLPFPAGNRDPEMFEAANEVRLDRAHNRHFAFGIGIHRCIGSNLARMELRVAVEEWLARFPRFALADGARVAWNGGQVRGPRAVPVTLEA